MSYHQYPSDPSGAGSSYTSRDRDGDRSSALHLAPPQLNSSYPPPNTYYPADGTYPPHTAPSTYHPAGPVHIAPMYSPNVVLEPGHERPRPAMTLELPHPQMYAENDSHWAHHSDSSYSQGTPYEYTSGQQEYPYSGSPSGESHRPDSYFPPIQAAYTPSIPQYRSSAASYPSVSSEWQSTHPSHAAPSVSPYGQPPHLRETSRPSKGCPSQHPGGSSGTQAKTTRQQFTACGACRHRRVKCDLREKHEQLGRDQRDDEDRSGPGPTRSSSSARRKKAVCTNCAERGTNCVDEYAPIKAAKQLRRGKRISEIEMLYGKHATTAAVASGPVDIKEELSPPRTDDVLVLPELTKEFFESAFFRRFLVQRPVLDPQDFVARYLSRPDPSAAAMGPEGAVLCHVLYAWALSYGVNERGELDVSEGGGSHLGPMSVSGESPDEVRREEDRQRRFDQMRVVLKVILKEIDECGILRKPTWDGVQSLLLVLPLTEGVSSPLERLAMYEAALNQAYALCSFGGLDYDGMPSRASGVNGGSDEVDSQNIATLRVRIYWYAFCHEGITTGLKGGRLHLDDEDLDTINDSIHQRAVIINSQKFRYAVRFATAPINLAMACRLINKALTGPSAKRRTAVNANHVKEAWEALERSWEEFEQLKFMSDSTGPYNTQDEVIRFADGWKIFLFEAQNIIRQNLDDRLSKLRASASGAFISLDGSRSPDLVQQDIVGIQHLLEIARSKCEAQTRQILEIVRQHVGSRFFEWDASLVRDGTYYAAMMLAGAGLGNEADMGMCLQALNEMRWAHAKAWDRSAELRREWQECKANTTPDRFQHHWSAAPYLPPLNLPPEGQHPQLVNGQGSGSLSTSMTTPNVASFTSSANVSPTGFTTGQDPNPGLGVGLISGTTGSIDLVGGGQSGSPATTALPGLTSLAAGLPPIAPLPHQHPDSHVYEYMPPMDADRQHLAGKEWQPRVVGATPNGKYHQSYGATTAQQGMPDGVPQHSGSGHLQQQQQQQQTQQYVLQHDVAPVYVPYHGQ